MTKNLTNKKKNSLSRNSKTTKKPKQYDVIVIGSGGGTKIASPAYQLGKKVAIIEEAKLGGTCLNRGCIPSKMLIHPANVATIIKDAKKFNINATFSSADIQKLLKRINKETDGDSKSIETWYKSRKNFGYYHGHAEFISDKIIKVNNQLLTAKKIFIATGARPFVPPIPGLKETPFMTSTQALRSRTLPKKLLVIGGGYIACELGYAYSALGSEVHWLVRDKALLRREDAQVSQTFTKIFAKNHKVHFNTNTTNVSYNKKTKQFTLTLETTKGNQKIKKRLVGDALLVATGVKPNSELLGLENTSIKTNKRGFIKANSYLQTTVKDVYALGDVVGNYMFRHSVNFEGEYLFNEHYYKKGKITPIKYPPIPHAVFTHPEIAGVGLTEEQLQEKKIPYVVGFNPYKKSAMGSARLSKDEFVKLLFHKKTRKLLGAHILGEEASNMVHLLIYAITNGATADSLLNMIYIHPALPEIVRNAVRNAMEEF